MLLGIVLKVAATFAFAAMSAIVKTVSARFPVGEAALFRSVFAMATLVVWLMRRGGRRGGWRAGPVAREIAARRPSDCRADRDR
jgi:hypothetical protein